MKVYIGEIQDISTIDYPGEVVSVLFFCGCPFRCPFCHNFHLIDTSKCQQVSIDKVIKEIENSLPFISGVVITGGEPLYQIDPLIELIKKIKEIGILVKIDTNGYYFKNLQQLLDQNIVDYIALDVKNELNPKSYAKAVGLSIISGTKIVKRIKESINLIINSNAFFEARTTIVPSLNDSETVIRNICNEIIGANRYVLQEYRCIDRVLDPNFSKIPSPSHAQLIHLAKIAKEYISDVRIRTAEFGEERIE